MTATVGTLYPMKFKLWVNWIDFKVGGECLLCGNGCEIPVNTNWQFPCNITFNCSKCKESEVVHCELQSSFHHVTMEARQEKRKKK